MIKIEVNTIPKPTEDNPKATGLDCTVEIEGLGKNLLIEAVSAVDTLNDSLRKNDAILARLFKGGVVAVLLGNAVDDEAKKEDQNDGN